MERRRTPSGASRPRDALDTLPADSDALVRLRDLSRLDADVDSLLAAPGVTEAPEARLPQLSIPFELNRPAPILLDQPRAPQPSVPFELSREVAIPRPSPARGDEPVVLPLRRTLWPFVIVLGGLIFAAIVRLWSLR